MKKLRLSKETIVSLEKTTMSNIVGGFWSIPTHCPDDYPDCSINEWCQSANTCTAYRWCPSDNTTVIVCQ